jgi:hypothetical protein
MTRAVADEAMFFAQRSLINTRFIFDDFKTYEMRLIQQMCSWYGFEEIDRGDNKICLEKQTP